MQRDGSTKPISGQEMPWHLQGDLARTFKWRGWNYCSPGLCSHTCRCGGWTLSDELYQLFIYWTLRTWEVLSSLSADWRAARSLEKGSRAECTGKGRCSCSCDSTVGAQEVGVLQFAWEIRAAVCSRWLVSSSCLASPSQSCSAVSCCAIWGPLLCCAFSLSSDYWT